MGQLDAIRQWLDEEFAGLLAEHEVPGAAVAVLAGDEMAEAAAGVLSLRTGVDVTTDSVFQIGSITKIWTTTLVMQLVDEGKLDLDTPVRSYLPEFRLADEESAASVTPRQLLCHLGGFEGDIFTATTRDDDAVERYLTDVLPGIPQHIRPGALHSYNNAGFVVLGRILEVLRGKTWAQVLREHLVEPLGLTEVATRADEAILFRAAAGHVRPSAEAPLAVTTEWAMAHSVAPAGAMLAMSARSVLGLARLHLTGGLAPDGIRLLAKAGVADMQERHADVPLAGIRARGWGLGWALYDWPGGTVIGHDGATIGQAAYFRMVPAQDVAVVLLTNGGRSGRLYLDVFGRVLDDLAGIRVPAPPTPPAQAAPIRDATRYAGRYEVSISRLDVECTGDGELWLTSTPMGEMADRLERADRFRLVRLDGRHTPTGESGAGGQTAEGGQTGQLPDVGGDAGECHTFVGTELREGLYPAYTFVGDDGTGRAAYLHTGRAIPRVD